MSNYSKETETWKDVVGYEGIYMISNLGRVKSLPRKYNKRVPTERIRKTRMNLGYEVVNLSKQGAVKTVKIHRLVAEAFLDNEGGKPEVNHIDGNKNNNNANNLEWVTSRENAQHASDEGLQRNSSKERAMMQMDMDGNVINVFKSGREAIRAMNATHAGSNVYRACKGKQQTPFGYMSAYADGKN